MTIDTHALLCNMNSQIIETADSMNKRLNDLANTLGELHTALAQPVSFNDDWINEQTQYRNRLNHKERQIADLNITITRITAQAAGNREAWIESSERIRELVLKNDALESLTELQRLTIAKLEADNELLRFTIMQRDPHYPNVVNVEDE